MIQMPRPCVASTRSFSRAWIFMSHTGTAGKLPVSWLQCPPRSVLKKAPNSVPVNSRLGWRGSSRTTSTPDIAGRLPLIDFQLLP